MIEELIAMLEEQPWMECREIRIVEAAGCVSLEGEWIVPYLEGVEPLSYLVSEVALLVRESEEPALAGARLHVEMLPSPAEEEHFPFRVWTDPLPPDAFERLVALVGEAIQLLEAEGEDEDESGNGFIPIDGL